MLNVSHLFQAVLSFLVDPVSPYAPQYLGHPVRGMEGMGEGAEQAEVGRESVGGCKQLL